jgi:hypothetical protein
MKNSKAKESIKIGKSVSFFSLLKIKNPELYNEYKRVGNGSLSTGYTKIQQEFEHYKALAQEVAIYATEKRQKSHIARDCYDNGLLPSITAKEPSIQNLIRAVFGEHLWKIDIARNNSLLDKLKLYKYLADNYHDKYKEIEMELMT